MKTETETRPARRRGRPPLGKTPARGAVLTAETAREARGTRRRRETRTRLLDAALRLMAERGADGVAINEITEAADVGFGSFYNHFSSKEAIHAALIEQVFDEVGNEFERMLEGVTDPAEVVATSMRYTLLRARADLTWARFLLRESLTASLVTRGLGRRLLRDIQRGIDSGRFQCDDALMAFLALGGGALAAITVEVQYRDAGAGGLTPELRRQLRLPCEDLPERTAAAMLRFLGIPPAEAKRIARRKLPPLALPALAPA